MVNTAYFPYAPLIVTFELYYSGTWNDITTYVRSGDGTTYAEITHGRQDEGTRMDPAVCRVLLDNTDGRFCPRNPTSPLYGLIGRNTPFRVKITWGGFSYSRFYGEVSTWPQEWEPSEADAWVTIEASGILRRIGAHSAPITSPVRRAMDGITASKVLAYWPAEDGSAATELASALSTGYAMVKRNTTGASSLAANSDIPGSSPLPTVDTGFWVGKVAPYTVTSEFQITYVMSAQSAPSGDGLGVSWTMTGSAGAWSMCFLTTGQVELRCWGPGKGRILTVTLDATYGNAGQTGPVDNACRYSVQLTQNGADIDYAIWCYSIEDNAGSVAKTGTLAGYTFGRCGEVSLNDSGSPNGTAAYGHVLLLNDITDIFGIAPNFYAADIGYADDGPSVRTQRICEENGIPYSQWFAPTATDSVAMGAQPIASVEEILSECSDLGYRIFDSKDGLELMLMPMEWRQARNVAFEVDYGKLSPPFFPVEDDQGLVNDVTVTRKGGGSARHVADDAPLSPAVVGIYDASVTLNLASDDLAQWWAQWLANMGAAAAPRYPQVTFDLLADHEQTLIPDLIASLEGNYNSGVEVGQMIRIVNTPVTKIPGPVELMINGWTETLGPWCWEITYNCSPAAPWRVWTVEDTDHSFYDDYSRGNIDTAGSETVGSFVAGTGTSLVVKTNSGPRWVTPADQAAAFPFVIVVAGVWLRVTSIAGTSTAGQTFTVTQTPVNGVTKTIPSGSAVSILPVRVGV